MNKKKNLFLIITLVLSIHFLLFLNNRQETSFRYFIWKIQEVSIGRLIFISFVSGLFMSSLLNKTLNNNIRSKSTFSDNGKTSDENEYSVIREENDEILDISPERDLRDPQPTISVNYRVIKNNVENQLKDRNQTMDNSEYDDDWNNDGSEW